MIWALKSKDLGLPTLSIARPWCKKPGTSFRKHGQSKTSSFWLQLKASKFREQDGTVSCTGKQFVIIKKHEANEKQLIQWQALP